MRENVGRTDQMIRAIIGPVLLAGGYALAVGRDRKGVGLAAMIAGALVTETAMTRTCPLNALFGINTAEFPAASEEEEPRFAVAPGMAAEAMTPSSEREAVGEWETIGGRAPLDYSNFVNAAASLTFIRNEENADAAVKAVLGILASRLDEGEARRLIANLPDPLSYESLRGHQINVTDISVEQYYSSLANQFHITHDQAQVLAVTILRLVKEALDTEGIRAIEGGLPDEWTQLIERV